MKDIFMQYLKELGVRYTKEYINHIYELNPDKNNLYGFVRMMNRYHIKNKSFMLERVKDSLIDIEAPFIAEIREGFGLIYRKFDDCIELLLPNNKREKLSFKEFLNKWSGAVLIGEKTLDSKEPNYERNRKNHIFSILEKELPIISVLILFIIVKWNDFEYLSLGVSLSLFVNILGLYFCFQLINQKNTSRNGFIKNICSIFNKNQDCNHVLNSKASILFGVFDLSEIGLGYFASNLLIIFYFIELYDYSSILSICSLIFTFWSVIYQKYVLKEWCILCLIVCLLLWFLNFINYGFGLINYPFLNFHDMIIFLLIYLSTLMIIHFIHSRYSNYIKTNALLEENGSFKFDEDVFNAILNLSKKEFIDPSLGITWGNKNANNVITVVSNPYCRPCKEMHHKLKEMMHEMDLGYKIQYILVTYNTEMEKSIVLFIGLSNILSNSDFEKFLDKWFNSNSKEAFFKQKYSFSFDNKKILEEVNRQKEFVRSLNINATPTIFFNGYLLPNMYNIEDLLNFENIETK